MNNPVKRIPSIPMKSTSCSITPSDTIPCETDMAIICQNCADTIKHTLIILMILTGVATGLALYAFRLLAEAVHRVKTVTYRVETWRPSRGRSDTQAGDDRKGISNQQRATGHEQDEKMECDSDDESDSSKSTTFKDLDPLYQTSNSPLVPKHVLNDDWRSTMQPLVGREHSRTDRDFDQPDE